LSEEEVNSPPIFFLLPQSLLLFIYLKRAFKDRLDFYQIYEAIRKLWEFLKYQLYFVLLGDRAMLKI